VQALWLRGGPALGVAAAVALLGSTGGLDEIAREGQLGPAFWPRLVLGGLVLACLGKLVGGWRAGAAEPGAGAPAISRPALAAGVLAILLYAAVAPALGFPLATALFVVAFMRLAGARSALMTGACAVLGTVGLLYLFVKVVYLPLPKGDGPFEALTLALYRALRIF
jgi:hypothetical protein